MLLVPLPTKDLVQLVIFVLLANFPQQWQDLVHLVLSIHLLLVLELLHVCPARVDKPQLLEQVDAVLVLLVIMSMATFALAV